MLSRSFRVGTTTETEGTSTVVGGTVRPSAGAAGGCTASVVAAGTSRMRSVLCSEVVIDALLPSPFAASDGPATDSASVLQRSRRAAGSTQFQVGEPDRG